MKQAQHICMHSEDHEKMILVYDRSSNGRDQQGVEQCASVYKGRGDRIEFSLHQCSCVLLCNSIGLKKSL